VRIIVLYVPGPRPARRLRTPYTTSRCQTAEHSSRTQHQRTPQGQSTASKPSLRPRLNQSWNRVTGHRVNNYGRVGSGRVGSVVQDTQTRYIVVTLTLN